VIEEPFAPMATESRDKGPGRHRALVFGGGGLAGIAWELGVMRGISDEDPELAAKLVQADLVLGTSAGSVVAAQVTSGVPLDLLYEAQLDTASSEISVDVVDLDDVQAAARRATSLAEFRQIWGAHALAATTVPETTRRRVIEARLPVHEWPRSSLEIPAIDAHSGERVVFTSQSDVSLVDAVAASCAVPGVWPAVSIDGRRFIDGGFPSGTNADLALGARRILIVAPVFEVELSPLLNLGSEISMISPPGQVLSIRADSETQDALAGRALSTTVRRPAAKMGRATGRILARTVADFWSEASEA
jgi:NTE family protein